MSRAPRATENVVAIFATMLERPRKVWYGLELAKHTGIGSATIYAALTRLERAGLLESTWETIDPVSAGRPRRRMYKLSAEGVPVGRQMVADYRPRVRAAGAWPGWLPGAQDGTT